MIRFIGASTTQGGDEIIAPEACHEGLRSPMTESSSALTPFAAASFSMGSHLVARVTRLDISNDTLTQIIR